MFAARKLHLAHMPRQLRIHAAGGFYHATLRGNHQQAVFQIDSDRVRLNEIVVSALGRYEAQLHAYCWMTNHLHFVIRVGDLPLGNIMRQIASDYARNFQRKLQTTGHLFERRYHARIVDTERYLIRLLQYIHMNPVAAGIVRHPGDYRWSSHLAYAGARNEPWVTTDFALNMLAGRRAEAIAAYLQLMACDASEARYPLDKAEADDPSPRPPATALLHQASPEKCQTLGDLIDDACRRFGTTNEQLVSSSRDAYLMQVRAWICKRAITSRIANLSEIARALGRDRSTLRHAMNRCRDEAE